MLTTEDVIGRTMYDNCLSGTITVEIAAMFLAFVVAYVQY